MIAYSSTHGSAAECAGWLQQMLNGAEIVDLKKRTVDPSPFDCVILGSSVYGGQIQQEVRSYCKRYLGILLQKPLGIYLTCLSREEAEIRRYLESGFPAELAGHLTSFCAPGGAIYFTKMNFLERNISKLLLNRFLKSQGEQTDGKTDYVSLSKEKMKEFAERMTEWEKVPR
ncbi:MULTISPECIES: flavodoxin domain-containing protein [Acutalibacteraceae]|uniref:flavodoxin domain-containing protein n=1 Tax=Acutalibacteraceae TaxID=3082771 RepID=UPI0013E8CDFE|nr:MULTISPECIES: flavodoxin domain-containing protein [Acutalibacteraceae]